MPDRAADCPRGYPGHTEPVRGKYRDFPVGHRFPAGNGLQDLPDGFPERRPAQRQFRGEFRRPAAEIEIQPALRLRQNGEAFFCMLRIQGFREMLLPVKPQAGQRVPVACQGNSAQRGTVMPDKVSHSSLPQPPILPSSIHSSACRPGTSPRTVPAAILPRRESRPTILFPADPFYARSSSFLL